VPNAYISGTGGYVYPGPKCPALVGGCGGDDTTGEGEPAVGDQVGTAQVSTVRIGDLEEVFAVGQTGGFGGGVRPGPAVQVDGAFGRILIGVHDGAVGIGGEDGSRHAGRAG